MANPRQRNKQRSGKPRLTRRNANKKAKAKIYGNFVIQQNWDKHATLRQNYARLGLLATPNYVTGGVEKLYPDPKPENEDRELTSEELDELKKSLPPGQAIVRRDDDGNIIEIIHGEAKTLDDVLDKEISIAPAKTEVVRQLEEEAVKKAARQSNKMLPLSAFEHAYIQRLINKYGTEDFESMAKDVKLNSKLFNGSKLKNLYIRMKATK